MKAILEFNLPDDQDEFDFATRGSKYYIILWELDQWLRSKMKYDDTLTDGQYEAYEKTREELRDMMTSRGITFDD
jgi:hypothetical protein